MAAIRDAFNRAFSDYEVDGVPASGLHKPKKSDVRAIGSVIEEANEKLATSIAAAAEGLVQVASWSALNALIGTRAGQAGRVIGLDAGTHTDPVVGDSAANEGEYSWSAAPAGWRRVGNASLRQLEDHADQWLAFSYPILWDRDGVWGPALTLYVSRYLTARSGGNLLTTGPYNEASSLDANYASFTLSDDLTHFAYLDFNDTTNPIKVVRSSGSAVPPRHKTEQILLFATIRQTMVHTDVAVVLPNELQDERLIFQRALVGDDGKLLVPSFYHWSRRTGFTYHSPTNSYPRNGDRYWEVPISTVFTSETRVYFDKYAAPNVSPIKTAAGTVQPQSPGKAGLILIASTLRGYVHSPFALAGDVSGGRLPNMFRASLMPEMSELYSSSSMPVDVTNATAVALGFTRGVQGSNA